MHVVSLRPLCGGGWGWHVEAVVVVVVAVVVVALCGGGDCQVEAVVVRATRVNRLWRKVLLSMTGLTLCEQLRSRCRCRSC